MAAVTLRLLEDVIPVGAGPAYLPHAERALYVVEGDVTVEFPDGAQNQQAGGAWLGAGPIALSATGADARVWRWEMVGPAPNRDGRIASAPAMSSWVLLSATLDLDPAQEWLMRCDRVSFPPAGVAWTHVHQGPGIRCCQNGEITIETEGRRSTYGPGEAWLELGFEPVLAPTTPDVPTCFIRCFLLPRACRGRSSIRYVHAEDVAREKVQQYFVFGERFVALPTATTQD